MKQLLLLFVCFLTPLRAEIVDRILAVVGDRVISWSAARAEANYRAFRSGQPPPSWDLPGSAPADDLRQVVSQMTDLALLEQARDRSPFFSPPSVDIQSRLQEIQQRFADARAYREALARYRLTEAELAERLERESRLLSFVDSALRPQVRVTAEQVESYYQTTLVPEFHLRQGEAQIPPLEEFRAKIEEVLTQEEINRQLEKWLQELRRSAKIKSWLESEPRP